MFAKLKKFNITIIIIFVAIALSLATYLVYLMQVREDLNAQTKTHLFEITDEISAHIDVKIEERMNDMTSFGLGLLMNGSVDSINNEKIDELKKIYLSTGYFSALEVIYENVEGYTKSIKEEKNVNGEIELCLYVPVTYDDVTIVIRAVASQKFLVDIIDVSAFGQKNNTFIVKRDGTVLATRIKNIDSLEDIFTSDKYSAKLVNNIQSRDSGFISYKDGKYKRYICYGRLSYNNLYMVSIVSANIVESNYNNVYKKGIIFAIEIFVIMLVLIGCIVYVNSRIKLYYKIVDERRNIYAKQSGCVFFEYKIKHKEMAMSGDTKKLFGYDTGEGFVDVREINIITEDSQNLLETMWGKEIESADNVKLEFLDCENKIKMVKGTMNAVRDKKKHVIKVVGTISGITE